MWHSRLFIFWSQFLFYLCLPWPSSHFHSLCVLPLCASPPGNSLYCFRSLFLSSCCFLCLEWIFFSLLPSNACFFHFCFLKSQFIGQLFHEAFPDPPVQVPPNLLSSCGNYFFSWWHVQCPDTILNTLLRLPTRRRTPWSKLCPSHWHPTGQVGGSWSKFVDRNEILIWRWWHLLMWVRYQLTFIADKHLIF